MSVMNRSYSLSWLKLLLLVNIVQSAVAATSQASFTLAKTTRTTLKCTTAYGTKSVASPIPTTTKTETAYAWPLVGTSVSTSSTTSTPLPVTSTVTDTSVTTATVTASTITNTFSTTSTITETTTDTETSKVTEFSRVLISGTTSTTTTTTIGTSNGFLPVKSTTATAYPNSAKKRQLLARGPGGSRKGNGALGALYAQKVTCTSKAEIVITIIIVKTATTTRTITLAPLTSTATATSIATSTSTVIPEDVNTTESFKTTITTNTISTTVVTQTVPSTSFTTTTITETATNYAACATNNILGPQSPNGFIEGINRYDGNYLVDTQDDEYSCCVSCITSNTCAWSLSLSKDSTRGLCYRAQSNTCPSQKAGFVAGYTTKDYDNGQTFIVSNGNCGYMYYGGTYEGS